MRTACRLPNISPVKRSVPGSANAKRYGKTDKDGPDNADDYHLGRPGNAGLKTVSEHHFHKSQKGCKRKKYDNQYIFKIRKKLIYSFEYHHSRIIG